MQPESLPQPVFLNLEFIFSWLWVQIGSLFSFGIFKLLEFLASVLIVIGLTILIYALMRLAEIKNEDKPKSNKKEKSDQKDGLADLPGATVFEGGRNEIWQNIRSKLLSDNASDWRLAIIEADIYLDRLLDQKGFYGDTLGDKLKNLSSDKLPSLQNAWEAHKVRNRIAHDGSDFVLTMPEARRVLAQFEIVFRDLGAIS